MTEIEALETIGKGLAHESLLLCQRDHLILIKAYKRIKDIIDERNFKSVAPQEKDGD